MSNPGPPVIVQHSPAFKHLAHAGGLLLLAGIIAFYAATKRRRGPRVRVLITWNDKILLVRNAADRNRWTLPGGGPKPGESHSAAAARELHEELGVQQPAKKLQFIKRYSKTEVKEPYDKICYHLNLSKTQSSKIVLNKEILEAQWFSAAHLPKRLSPVVKLALAQLQKSPGQ